MKSNGRFAAILVCALAGIIAHADGALAVPPQVFVAYPVRNRVNVPAATLIQVTFNSLIDASTVNAITFRAFGRWSGPAAGTLSVVGSTVTFTPAQPFFAGECVTVNVSKGVKSVDGEALAKGYAWNFWIATVGTLIDLHCVGRITALQGGETWVQIYGAYAGDLNNDGWSDLTVPCEQTSDARVFLNSAGSYGSFTVEPLTNGNVPSPNEGGDFDNDGEIDVVVANTSNDRISILFGDGTGDFPNGRKTSYPTPAAASHSIRGVCVLDLNGDGWDDIVAADRFANRLAIFLNNGDGTFATAVAKESGGNNEYSLAVADANNDGQLDVFCGAFESPFSIIILLSDGNGGLTAQAPTAAGGRPWQIVVGDFNGDGNVDVAGANSSTSNMGVLLGNGAGGYLGGVTTYATGSFPIAIDAGDIDGDGDLELVSSNYAAGTWTIYENRGGLFVNPKTLTASSSGSCALLHDRDNDGDLDITGFDEIDDWIYFFENDPPTTGVKPTPSAFATLFQNHPNPFNPTTTIRFELVRAADVDLSIYDASGSLVIRLAHGRYPAGATDLNWNGADAKGRRVGSGVYFYRLVSNGEAQNRKMVLLK